MRYIGQEITPVAAAVRASVQQVVGRESWLYFLGRIMGVLNGE